MRKSQLTRVNYESTDLGFSYALVTVVMVVASVVLGLIFGNSQTSLQFWVMQGAYTLLIGSSAIWYSMISKTQLFAATKLNKPPKFWHVVWGCVTIAFLVLVMSEVNKLLLDTIEDSGFERPTVNFDNNLVGLLLCACVLPAFTEELVFRGTVAQSLYNFNKVAALCISGALFALFHCNPAQTLHQFCTGVILTLLAFRSGSLWTSVIVHFFNNLFVVVLSYTPLDSEAFWDLSNPWALTLTIVGAFGIVVSMVVYLTTTQSSWIPTSNKNEIAKTETESADEANTKSVINNKLYSVVFLVLAVVVCGILWAAQLF